MKKFYWSATKTTIFLSLPHVGVVCWLVESALHAASADLNVMRDVLIFQNFHCMPYIFIFIWELFN